MPQKTVIFLGPQGSGKGTQASLLREYLTKADSRPVVYFTTGTALRAFAASEGYTQELVRPLITEGKLMPTFIPTSLFAARLIGAMHGNEHLLLDGFPRTIGQTADLDSAMQFYERTEPTVLRFVLSDDAARARLRARGRGDDTPEGIEERLRWSHEEAAAVDEWFKGNTHYRFVEVNAEQPIEKVHADVVAALQLQ